MRAWPRTCAASGSPAPDSMSLVPVVRRRAWNDLPSRAAWSMPAILTVSALGLSEVSRAQASGTSQSSAKAMVVTSSRLHAVRYKQEFDKYLAEKGYDPVFGARPLARAS